MFGSREASVEVDRLSGQATIVSLREGGPYINDRPTITMELDVELPGREQYRAQARQVVGRLVIGRLQPGTTIPVRVDPKELANVIVDEPAMLGSADAPVEQRDPLEKLQRLAELRDAGALTEEEFTAKKAEILKDV
jgi:hypothetical protein